MFPVVSSSQSWLPDLTAPAAPRMNHGSGQVGVGTKRALSTGSRTVIKRRPTSAPKSGLSYGTGSRPDGDGEKQKLSSGSYLPALAPGLPGHTSPKRMPIGGGSKRASSSQSWLPDLTAPAAPKSGLSLAGHFHKKVRPTQVADRLTNPWRTSAKEDLHAVAAEYGSDLAHVFAPELSEEEARNILQGTGVVSLNANNFLRWSNLDEMKSVEFQFWEIFSGSGHATICYLEQYRRMLATGSSLEPASMETSTARGQYRRMLATGIAIAGPPVDIAPCRPGAPAAWRDLPGVDLRVPSQRRLIWAYMKVFKPKWVHTAPPCTFWTPLAHRNNKRSDATCESMRLEALVFIIFSVQLCRYQLRAERFCSFEQPPSCASWRLDIINELVSALAGDVMFDSCAWGHRDPGNNEPYLKRQRLIGNVSLASLCRRCSCQCKHQTVEGTITCGPRRGAKRSVVAGEYPLEFCRALADLIRAHVDVRNQ